MSEAVDELIVEMNSRHDFRLACLIIHLDLTRDFFLNSKWLLKERMNFKFRKSFQRCSIVLAYYITSVFL